MKVRQIFVVFFIICCFYGFSQDLNSEIGFKYVKADYLIKTQRNDEAIKELNDIINENASFNNVLFLRADLKFKSGDYSGARADALKSLELKGITAESAAILGRSEFALNNKLAAELTLEAAIKLGINEEKVLLDYASILLDKKSLDKACVVWQTAARSGSSTAAINISKYCGANGNGSIPLNSETTGNQVAESGANTTTPKSEPQNTQVTIQDNSEQQTSVSPDSLSGGSNGFSFPVPEEDNTVNDVVIDEDLTISLFGQGIGRRKILEKPSILILSEKDGEVAIEICVNENGRVETAEFIAGKSTIDNKGLVSLAVRKSKDFWFEKSDFIKQCGFIIYKVKGS